jgi:hypothetical protein
VGRCGLVVKGFLREKFQVRTLYPQRSSRRGLRRLIESGKNKKVVVYR